MKQIQGTGVGKVGKVYAGRGTEAQSMSTTMALRSAIAKIVQYHTLLYLFKTDLIRSDLIVFLYFLNI